MKVCLIDTQVLLWYLENSPRLSRKAEVMISSATEAMTSIASLWEIAIKLTLGKLKLKVPFEQLIEQTADTGISILPISTTHLLSLQQLPLHHRDPFDRLIAAQALSEQVPLGSSDSLLEEYGIQRIF